MVELTRRLFLIGSASAIAAVALPTPTLEVPTTEIIPVPAVQAYRYRQIFDICATFEAYPTLNEQSYGEVTLRRHGGLDLLHGAIINGGYFRWGTYSPISAFAFLANQLAELELKSNIKSGFIGDISMYCLDKVDDGPPVELVEAHNFVNGTRSVTTNFVYPNNSLSARLEREEARKRRWEEFEAEDLDA